MKTILRISAVLIVLVLMLVELVPEAQAIYGTRRRTRRRTAVVVSSATAASATAATAAAASSSQKAAAAEQEAAAAKQETAAAKEETAAAQQQLAAAQTASGVLIGTVVQALPSGCKAVTVANAQYQECAGSFYRTAFQGNNLVYVVVENPL